jgi:uncharacterized protein (DUF3084 family)
LIFQNNDLKNQISLAKESTGLISAEAIRKKVESELEPIIDEHKLLKKERVQLLKEAESAKIEKEKLEDLQDDLERKLNKLGGDIELTNSLLNEKRNENAYLTNTQNKI